MKEPYRAFKINDKILELSSATKLKIDKKILHLDEMEDKTWRLTFSETFIKDFTKVEKFVFSDKTMKIEGIDKEITLSKISPIQGEKQMIQLEELKNGTFKFLYSNDLIPDIKLISEIIILRIN